MDFTKLTDKELIEILMLATNKLLVAEVTEKHDVSSHMLGSAIGYVVDVFNDSERFSVVLSGHHGITVTSSVRGRLFVLNQFIIIDFLRLTCNE